MSFRDKAETHQWDTPNWTRRGLYETLRENINDVIRESSIYGSAPDSEIDRAVDGILTLAIGGAVSQEETLGFGDEDMIPLRFTLIAEIALMMSDKWGGEDDLPKPPQPNTYVFPLLAGPERAAVLRALSNAAGNHADAIESRDVSPAEKELHKQQGALLNSAVKKIIGVPNNG